MHKPAKVVLAVLLAGALNFSLRAQELGVGRIKGIVGDPSGAVIVVGDSVPIRHELTGVETNVTSNSAGEYAFGSLPISSYSLTVSFSGFRTEVRTGVRVVSGETRTIDDELTVAQVALVVPPRRAVSTPTVGTVKENPKDGLKYVWISPGFFEMGCSPGDSECESDEKPQHQVTITKGFWMGQTEVTVGAYKRFARSAGRAMPPEPKIMDRALNSGWNNEAMPIVDMTWDEARDYCTWAGGRLPTEAEWEYAARGGSTEARYGPLDEVAWYAGNSGQQRLDSDRIWKEDQKNYVQRLNDNGNGMHEVAQKRANGFGLYDVLGNVWEWVYDRYDAKYYQISPSQDPAGPASGQTGVMRGGSWHWNLMYIRVSKRHKHLTGHGSHNVGVRCVWEVDSH